jgi:signal transduction histidine kinase
MLAIVISSLNLLKRRLPAGRSDVDELIAGGIDGAQQPRHAAVARVRTPAPLSPEALEVNRLINGLGDLIYRTIGEDIRVETVLAAGLWTVHADASQLENAILNLAVNARDAMADGGKLTIETSNSYLDEDYAQQHEDVTSGQFVLIAVTDTGSGMATEAVARAFEPFYTTKAPGRGTGLGLAQVYAFVKQSWAFEDLLRSWAWHDGEAVPATICGGSGAGDTKSHQCCNGRARLGRGMRACGRG